MSSRDSLVVELIGTPGAGKTTLAAELVAQLRARGVDAGTILDVARDRAARTPAGRLVSRVGSARLRRALLWRVFHVAGSLRAIAFGMRRRSLGADLVRAQLARPISPAMKRHGLYWFFQLAGRHEFLGSTARSGEALVIDDGFLHRTVALFASHLEEPDPTRVASYVDAVPRPDLVVHAVASLEVCERRVRERGVWRHSRHLDEASLSRSLANAERVVVAAVGRARELGWNVVEVDTGGRALELVREDLARAIEPLAGTRTLHAVEAR